MKIRKLISGGQTGADQAAIWAALALGIDCGGWVPKGWRTEDGAAPWLQDFGYVEARTSGYPARTKINVEQSDATLVFGDRRSRGSALTIKLCQDLNKPALVVGWETGNPLPSPSLLAEFLNLTANIEVLNIAGNRENKAPGISSVLTAYLITSLRDFV